MCVWSKGLCLDCSEQFLVLILKLDRFLESIPLIVMK
ncbi:uncharacterized protein J3R85_014264 [Psidium guajava]|nr:uncharacterized protein J3R85_014264 [Psidium guajava]